MPTATAEQGCPGPPAPPEAVFIYPWERSGRPPPGSNRCRVKPKAEPPSGRPREGEFSSPVTARRTARRASRPFLPSATSSHTRHKITEHDHPASCPEAHRPQHQPSSIAPRLPLRFPPAISHPGHPLAPNAHSAPGPTLHICVVVGRGRGSPGWSEAERRRPPSSRPGAEPQTTIERVARVFVWGFGL
jgi:hypothetical protein